MRIELTTWLKKACLLSCAAAAVALGAASADAGLIARWELSESPSDLTDNGNGTWDGVVESVGGLPSQIWGPGASEPLPTGLVGNAPGVNSGDKYYAFGAENANQLSTFGVNTGSNTIIPTTTDFSLFTTVRFNNGDPGGQQHFFSDNNGQTGRANLGINNGDMFFFVGDPSVYLPSTQPTLFDGNWHTVGINRDTTSATFNLILDGNIVASTADTGNTIASNTQWLIGRGRGGGVYSTADISDVQIFDDARTLADPIGIPEPTTLLLTVMGGMLLAASGGRKRSCS